MKQVFISSLTWSSNDFDHIVECFYDSDEDTEIYNVLNSYSDEEKAELVANAIEDVEDRVMEMINENLMYWISIEAKKIREKK